MSDVLARAAEVLVYEVKIERQDNDPMFRYWYRVSLPAEHARPSFCETGISITLAGARSAARRRARRHARAVARFPQQFTYEVKSRSSRG